MNPVRYHLLLRHQEKTGYLNPYLIVKIIYIKLDFSLVKY